MGFKAGMTHIVRDVDKPGSKLHKKEVCEPVTIIECPALVVVGVVGYATTHRGNRTIGCAWAAHINDTLRRRFYKNWYRVGWGKVKRERSSLCIQVIDRSGAATAAHLGRSQQATGQLALTVDQASQQTNIGTGCINIT